jgi:hypothetical protein
MNNEQYQASIRDNMTRREFMRDSTLAAAGLAVGLGTVAGQTAKADETSCKTSSVGGLIKTTRSYNSNMEYRRLGQLGRPLEKGAVQLWHGRVQEEPS